MHGTMQILVQHVLARRLKDQLRLVGLGVEGGFHGRGQGQPGNGIDAAIQQPGIDGLGQTQRRQLELDQHHVARRVRRTPRGEKAPQQDIGVFFDLGT